MQVKKKYAQLISFIKIFNKYNDADSLVEINDNKFNILKEFAETFVEDFNESGYIFEIPENTVTSNVNNLKIDVVESMPENVDNNTLYIIK